MGRTLNKRTAEPDGQTAVRDYFAGSILAKLQTMEELAPAIEAAGKRISASLAAGGKWILFGNGGSAADAQHLAAEMVGRLYKMERRGLPALALTTDSSALTGIANDYGYDQVFSRQLEALAKKGDVVMGLSTSGNSVNVIRAMELANKMGCLTLGMSGSGGGRLAKACELCLTIPSAETFHIQESQITVGHLLCFLVEKDLAKRGFIKARKGGRA